jgi:gluconolactonase
MKNGRLPGLLLLACLTGCSGGSTPAPEPAPEPRPAAPAAVGSLVRLDPAFDAIAPKEAAIEKIAGGFDFTEGPLYLREGALLFSDVPRNVIYRWTPGSTATEFRKPSGYDGSDAPAGAYIGSNGLTLDSEGRLVICEHGNGRVTRLEKDGRLTVLADKYQGKRLNSPNDLVYKSDGALYFTDPPYGFPKQDDDPKKELKFNGVYRLAGGKLTLLTKELTRPNGLAFSPDEKTLYVANSDPARKIWMRYEVKADGRLGAGSVFHDVTAETAEGLPDGLKVDVRGNVYCTGPGGVWVFSPEAKLLGRIAPPETPANCHWGKRATSAADAALAPGEEARTLYMTARKGVYRVELAIAGLRP